MNEKIEFMSIKELGINTIQFILFLGTSSIVFNLLDKLIKLIVAI